MDHAYYGRPPTRRRTALGDATLRANEDHRARSPRHGDKLSPHDIPPSSPETLPHNESLEPNGSLAVRHPPQPSPQHKRLSAVIDECRPHNSKRDSEVSNASTNASNASRRKTHVGPWNLGKTIGRGGCSRVRIVRHSTTGQYGAAKIISKATADKVRALSLANLVASAENDPTMLNDGRVIPIGLEREICIMKLLDHPNIVRLYDIWENRNEIYLIMEYIEGGELFSYIGENGSLPEDLVVYIFRQIIAALLYCHRINIHHRDLKPENILLDRTNMSIKLVDFGMAALQPTGSKLTTPCGSPHYAAPEVIKSKPYDGGQADVWSCGVILFVLLTGTPPFNYSGDERDLPMLFRAISKAEYQMPRGLSVEATDLIRRILIPDPRKRITLSKVWNHALLRKYDPDSKESLYLERWIGPEPSLPEWEPLDLTMIDREILRHMRTLWHSEPEAALISRLLNKDINYEKFFYTALQKYQHDQMENYVPQHTMAYSNSDYHHNKRPILTKKEIMQMPGKQHKRSRSGFSILNDEHLYSEHSFYEPPPSSEASYDPFRASRDPIVPTQSLHQNITVHRGSSVATRSLRPATALGHHSRSTRSTLRVQAMTRNSKNGSAVSRTSSKRSNPSSHRSVMSGRHGSVSRSSLVSSHYPSSPPVFRPQQGMYKRGVSFSHLRRSSVATASTAETGGVHYTPEQRRYLNNRRESVSSSMHPSPLSPRASTVGSSPATRPLPKVAAGTVPSRLKVRKPESPSKYIQSEVRKVSTELGKVMEEAFNRSSMSSSVRTRASGVDGTKDEAEYDTPPTSFSNRDSGGTAVSGTPDNKAAFQDRPLPPIPDETPHTFLKRKLAETRLELARRFEQGGDGTQHLKDVYRQLDTFMDPSIHAAKRIASAPAKSDAFSAGPLQAIPEEVKDGEERPAIEGRRALTEQNTIRLVDQSPTHIEPLNIRKRSTVTSTTRLENDRATTSPWPGPTSSLDHDQGPLGVRAKQAPSTTPLPLDADVPEKKEGGTLKKKKSSWFRRNLEEKEAQKPAPPPGHSRLQIPEAWQGLDDRIKADARKTGDLGQESGRHTAAAKRSEKSISSEFPMRNCGTALGKSERGGGALKQFFNFFGKKPKDGKKPGWDLGDNFSTSSIWSDFNESDSGLGGRPGPPEFQTNWLSRFLHIKPASKTLCFKVGRPRARKELLRLLREWECRGVRDVAVSPDNKNVVNARVDKNNYLKIKPVSLVIELFVVCDNGRRTQLCCARFTQTRGAASSFRKTVDIVEDVCANKGLLVTAVEVKENMLSVLGA
ncbi:Pkinase-domain-containing protein [Byssothecium circinans]|uniref:non-specific serine/threonine protein kinase n=1 Tax=Byssothecium circinans TaxID=147558 RepID=A0A6A5UCY4_9PLEO|nr:Pkinase-domain-containing protein [Byssothecium circinans]